VLAAIFLGQPITATVILGGVLILGAGAIATIAGQLRIREPDL